MNSYYKNPRGEIFVFSPIQSIPDGFEKLTKEETDAYLNPPSTIEGLFSSLRTATEQRLAATDKYLLPDSPIIAESLAGVKAYRQALRELPALEGAPFDGGGELTPWPELPSVG